MKTNECMEKTPQLSTARSMASSSVLPVWSTGLSFPLFFHHFRHYDNENLHCGKPQTYQHKDTSPQKETSSTQFWLFLAGLHLDLKPSGFWMIEL